MAERRILLELTRTEAELLFETVGSFDLDGYVLKMDADDVAYIHTRLGLFLKLKERLGG